MDFSWSNEQLALRDEALNFASRHLGQNVAQQDKATADAPETWRDDWRKCAEFGIFGLFVAKEYGGRGLDALTTILVLEALGYGCRDNGLTLAINGQMWAVQEPILSFGTDDQKRRYLPGLCDGSMIGAVSMTEHESGSNAAGIKMTAEPVDGGYILNGRKAYVGLGPSCDLALVFASTAPDRGSWGISRFCFSSVCPIPSHSS